MKSPGPRTSSGYTQHGDSDKYRPVAGPPRYPRTERTVLFAITAHLAMGLFLAALLIFICACIWVIAP